MRSLATRAVEDEQMDAADLDPATYARVLRDLARVNRVTLARRPTLDFVARAVAGAREFRLLDVGFGQGDMLRSIALWCRSRGIAADLVGIDLNPNSAPAARAVTPRDLRIAYRTGDYATLDEPFDLIVSSLVTHHMPEDQLVAFLRHMERVSARGWMVNDLHRHRLAYAGFPVLARLMGCHRIVREDGALSIARSFRAPEWQALLAQAGVPSADGHGARVIRRFPFRLCVERIR